MPDDPRITDRHAVVDRILDGTSAVLLVGTAETELVVPVDHLPEEAGEGSWLTVAVDTDPPAVLGLDHDLTAARGDELEQSMNRIRRQRTGGRFDHS